MRQPKSSLAAETGTATGTDSSARTPGRRDRAGGFTLIEILVAVFILGAMMLAIYGFVISTVKVKRRVERQTEGLATGPAILNQLANDLRCAYGFDIKGSACFEGLDDTRGLNQAADSLHLITTRNSRPTDDMELSNRSDLSEVSYVLRQSPDQPEFLELFRREQFWVDDAFESGGKYRKLYDKVISFDILYYGGGTDMEEDAEGVESWSSQAEGRLPKAVIVELKLGQGDDPEANPRVFKRKINLPLGAHMALEELEPLLAEMRKEISQEGDNADAGRAGGRGGQRGQQGGGRGGRGGRERGAGGNDRNRGGGRDGGGLFGGGGGRRNRDR